MTKKLEFFFDYVSPYSYLANSQLNSIKGIEIQYRPMFLGVNILQKISKDGLNIMEFPLNLILFFHKTPLNH